MSSQTTGDTLFIIWTNWNSLKSAFYPKQSLEEVRSIIFWRDVFLEFILCSYLLAVVMWVIVTLNPTAYLPSTLHFGIFAGFIVLLLLVGYSRISGAPFNPAVCWALFVTGRMSFVKMFFFTIAEVVGCIVGSYVGFSLNPLKAQATFPAIKPSPELTGTQGMAIEGILTFNAVFVALSCTDPNLKPAFLAEFAMAFCTSSGILAAGTHTGGLQNPIIAFGAALMANDWENHWLYWAGPYIGGTIGSLFYQTIQLINVIAAHRKLHHEKQQLESQSSVNLTEILIRNQNVESLKETDEVLMVPRSHQNGHSRQRHMRRNSS